ncbi:DinB family protein [Anditalea andensis]|uniref:Damage-inducible protein DinB n=1 Tax=Anditalea andensis TaxID=1048983 RepID=A0A074L638_9BACT|nr:DinB family protein [Anditalea andensis]KEO75303.1 damage-inducible protein DinB [Anditalea andensis]
METKGSSINQEAVITPQQLFEHWQAHRGLTRKVIAIFPEDELFNFSIGGMRPFADMVKELLAIAEPGLKEIATGKKEELNENLMVNTKLQLLEMWDKTSETLPGLWEKLSTDAFQKSILAFGQYEGTIISTILYFIDNEIHHRGQSYVYLRALGITPPPFWER